MGVLLFPLIPGLIPMRVFVCGISRFWQRLILYSSKVEPRQGTKEKTRVVIETDRKSTTRILFY